MIIFIIVIIIVIIIVRPAYEGMIVHARAPCECVVNFTCSLAAQRFVERRRDGPQISRRRDQGVGRPTTVELYGISGRLLGVGGG